MTWIEFLQDHGAEIINDQVVSFGNSANEARAALHDNVIVNISNLAVIEVSGNDAETFLQGQITCDLTMLAVDNFLPGAWCNPKGQVITNFYIFRNKTSFLLLVPADIRESFIKRISMYILRSDVAITDKTNEMFCVGVEMNNEAGEKIADYPKDIYSLIDKNQYFCLRVMDDRCRYILAGTLDAIKNIWQQLSPDMTPIGNHHWPMLDILAGIPWINNSNSEKYLPQFLNLDALNSVSFDKGCFPGQEIIARLRYRGEVKHRLFLASVQQDKTPGIGEDLVVDDNEKRTGIVLNAAPHPDYGFVFLAVLEIEHANRENIVLKNTGNAISLHPLPYTITT